MKRKDIVIVVIIAVIVIAITSYSYAYFLAHIDNSSAIENTFTAGKMEVTFTDGPEISMDNAHPGQTINKTFTVRNTGDFETTYNLKLDNVVNTFKDKTDLVYTLKRNSEVLKTLSVPKGNNYIATELPISIGGIDTYEITIEFKETPTNQNDNQGANFSGKIQVDSEENVNLLTNPKVTLYQGMIPVDYDGKGNVVVADTENNLWYDYTVSEWANAVLVNAEDPTIKAKYFDGDNLKTDIANTIIPMEDILQMYVYIPRYKYQLFNVNNEGVPKQIINIQFENGTDNTGDIKCTYTNNGDGTITEDCKNKNTNGPARNGEWYTHPAFTFKGTTETSGTELPGIWVGKFEPSDPTDPIGRNDTIGEISILPDKTSMVDKTVSTMFYATRNIETNAKYNLKSEEIDTHMMKNIEWGAMAYLTQSLYGIYKDDKTCGIDNMSFSECEVWINNTAQGTGTSGSSYPYGGTYTGCVGDSASASAKWNTDNTDGKKLADCDEKNRWNQSGLNASTTGNMYGIYDISGGTWDNVMGVIIQEGSSDIHLGSSGFKVNEEPKLPDQKYYDVYTFNTNANTQDRGHLGDSTRETLQTFSNTIGGWNSNYTYFPSVSSKEVYPWFQHGGRYDSNAHAGVLAFTHTAGGLAAASFRSILTAQ